MEGFTIGLALLDAVPVLFYSISMLLIASRFSSILFIVGAVVSTLAACGKVLWKLILGICNRNVVWLNRYFLPTQITGFCMMLLAFAWNFRKIRWAAVLAAVTDFPGSIFFLLWALGMGTMSWYRKRKFDNSAGANRTAEIINTLAQAALLTGLLLTRQ